MSAVKLCKFCDKGFQHSSSLSRHIKSEHSKEQENGSVLCNETQCNSRCEKSQNIAVILDKSLTLHCWCVTLLSAYIFFRFMTLKELIHHLQSAHNKSIEIAEKVFNDFEAFSNWKDEEERKSNSSYVQQCGPQTTVSSNTKRYYYYCHRSGSYSGKGSGSCELKVQGSCKLGFPCTAYIKATENLANKVVHIEFCFFHYNHAVQLAHLKMPEDLRKDIACKLQEGVSEKKVLDIIRSKVHGEIGREHLQDIQNIR